MAHLVSATFKTRMAAESALHSLEMIGVTERQISMIMSDETRGKMFNIETHSKADQGVAGGATAGGILGAAILGAMAAAAPVVFPGVGLVITGALAGSVAGLAAGAVTGGIVGGLIGAGFTEHEAKLYEKEVKAGSVLIAVDAKDADQKKAVTRVFEQADAYNLAA